ncbi:transposase [Caballeronia grimmiae]|uniref:Transposase n=1 Tax=Caballeronia grimmiae TaxID=1071679 RepID=A0ABQ1RKK8_9BURK|nr:transposase [Caballeronia grimmiae]GGD70018.1 hypothetical protein GCM10010985_25670 [Caballeronia grimmiae]
MGEKTKAQIARELGIRVNLLRNWRLEFEEEERSGTPKRQPVQEDVLAKLLCENVFLRQENEF